MPSSTFNAQEAWREFLAHVKQKCSATAFGNWLHPIQVVDNDSDMVVLEVPNIFVQEYLLTNYKRELCIFLPEKSPGEPSVEFRIAPPKKKTPNESSPKSTPPSSFQEEEKEGLLLNQTYTFDRFIEGPSNQFVKSAAIGVAARPGKSYNPLFIHGGVGLGKTHLLHSIGHYIQKNHKKLRIQCITTEAFINDLVDNLRNKSVDKMKRYYRTLDVLLVDDIQFLQNRTNFEEEFCNTFEALLNQGKQIVIASDKPPGQLKLSERMVARMEWGLVAHVGIPDLETRVAILQHKAEQKSLKIPNKVAFFIAEHIYHNVRQLEGAVNRLSAQSRLLNKSITEELVEKTLSEMLQHAPRKRVSVDQILKSVATVFQVKVSELRGASRTKDVALPRQVAMYLAKEMINESLMMLGASFGGRTHSTILHAYNSITKKMKTGDDDLVRMINMIRHNVEE